MKNSSKMIISIIMLLASVLIFSMLSVSASEVSTPQRYVTTDDSVEIEVKHKKVTKIKVTFHANGGKIGSKKTITTTVKKGSKLKKLATTPIRKGYTFQGWFTKKKGGKEISKNTKPKKTVNYYAQWKKTRVLTSEEKKLVGMYVNGASTPGFLALWSDSNYDYQKWMGGSSSARALYFKSDGTYEGASIYYLNNELSIFSITAILLLLAVW